MFHFELPLPAHGRLVVRDTNFASSEGTSRLAVRGRGVAINGMVRRSLKSSRSRSGPSGSSPMTKNAGPNRPNSNFGLSQPQKSPCGKQTWHNLSLARLKTRVSTQRGRRSRSEGSCSSDIALAGSRSESPWVVLARCARAWGGACPQPGHGKTLVTAVAIGPDVRVYQPALLGVATTAAHTGVSSRLRRSCGGQGRAKSFPCMSRSPGLPGSRSPLPAAGGLGVISGARERRGFAPRRRDGTKNLGRRSRSGGRTGALLGRRRSHCAGGGSWAIGRRRRLGDGIHGGMGLVVVRVARWHKARSVTLSGLDDRVAARLGLAAASFWRRSALSVLPIVRV